MLFPALPWEPCLYYNKAQPRSFLGQTSAAGHLLIVSSPEHRDREEGSAFQRRQQQQQHRSPACNLVCASAEPAWEAAVLQTAVHPEPCEHRRSGDSRCVCPPLGSRGADVIQQLFWQAPSSPAGRAGRVSLRCSAVLPARESSRMAPEAAGMLVRRGFCC